MGVKASNQMVHAVTDNEKQELIGKRFGSLVVCSLAAPQPKSGSTRYYCKCDCGEVTTPSRSDLLGGKSRSCGCFVGKQANEFGIPSVQRKHKGKYNKIEASTREIYSTYKSKCKRKNREWGLSYEQFRDLIFSSCSYCGSPPSNQHRSNYHEGTTAYNGIDRIDSTVGYVEGNVVTSCAKCNVAKQSMSALEFISWVYRAHAWISTHEIKLDKFSKMAPAYETELEYFGVEGGLVG